MKEKADISRSVHTGHRKRVRERFRKEGLEGFAPHEVLELLLFYGRARGNVNPLAHALIEHFGSLRGVLEAEHDQLLKVDGVGEETATLISMLVPVFRRYAAEMTAEHKVLLSRADAIRYCIALQAGRRKESLFAIFINSSHEVLGQKMIAEGTISEVPAYPRVLVETALAFNAQGVVLCHNHPGGSVIPSRDDVEATRRMERILAELDITLLDHIIVAGEMTYSMTCHGVIRLDDEMRNAYDRADDAAKPGIIVPVERTEN